ncbi:glycosyltransferase family 87 protein [Bradyrhizobium sp. CCBAU 51753]|uniref:glycosyltransferase family 87 protein n=1 Tax=Bradyrhizobium sp. CCBAU 51753 TaxID=1325100 RepID=UPI00188D1128|nr:glycosyltransferase family 87 protein [Bradyrhizobium sp. CCBAU 51753]
MSQKFGLEGHSLAFADDASPDDRRPVTGEAQAAPRPPRSLWSAALRDADWLTHDRVTAFTRVFLVLLMGFVASIPWTAPTMDVGHDFAAFWTAAHLALEGRVADAYGEAARAAVAALLGQKNYAPFFYPPTALLIWLPFALLPFVAAAAVWVAATAAAYAAAARAMLKGGSVVPALAFPAAWVCGLFGQNSLFSTALLGGSAMALDRYPIVAGALIGCLTYKPQIALLAPLVLVVTRRWRALAAAVVTTLTLMAIATALFGIDAWIGFIRALPEASAWNIGGAPGFEKFASPYAAIRLLGGSSDLAWIVQLAAAAIAVAVLAVILRTRPGGAAEIALMVAVTGLCVPFFGNYELVILAIPGAWLAAQALARGWLPYERLTLAALYLTPFIMVPAGANSIPLGPFAVTALIAVVVRRIRHLPQF